MGALNLEDIAYTYDDYRQWEGNWELINGIAVAMSPAPVRKHQGLAAEFLYHIREQLDDCTICEVLSKVDYKVSDNTVLRPDIALTCNETNDAYLTKAPEIIVEILSSATAKRDEHYKFDIYEAEKVRYYILVYPDELLAKVYKLDGKTYDKQGDFTHERYDFDETTCNISVDFSKIFARFRKSL